MVRVVGMVRVANTVSAPRGIRTLRHFPRDIWTRNWSVLGCGRGAAGDGDDRQANGACRGDSGACGPLCDAKMDRCPDTEQVEVRPIMRRNQVGISWIVGVALAACAPQSAPISGTNGERSTSAGVSGTVEGSARASDTVRSIDAARRGGCINKPLDVCLHNLEALYRISPYESIADQVRGNEAVDVNGQKVRKKNLLIIEGYMEGWPQILTIDLEYTASRTVSYIGLTLPSDPSFAETSEDYAKTGLYEGIVLLLGSECQNIGRLDVYKFFQNSVKPKIIREGKTTEIHDTSAEISYFSKALNIPFCGRNFSYTHLVGYDTNDITIDNPHGAYVRTSISFQ